MSAGVPPPLHSCSLQPCQETADLVYRESKWRALELGPSGTVEHRGPALKEREGMTCLVPTGSCGGAALSSHSASRTQAPGLHPLQRMPEASPQGNQKAQEDRPEGTDIWGSPPPGPGGSILKLLCGQAGNERPYCEAAWNGCWRPLHCFLSWNSCLFSPISVVSISIQERIVRALFISQA